MQLDLVIRGGSVVNADGAVTADVGISGERIVAIGAGLGPGKREIDARGKLVMPGGVDSHCHIEQVSSFGIMCADDFHSATVSAAFGGTTTVIPFCAQHRNDHIPEQILDVLATARAHGALTMVHAENHGMISWLAGKMVGAGNVAPRYHAICHTRSSEAEAINRVIALAELVDTPILIVHVSTIEGVAAIRAARARGVKVYGETCPQYLFLTGADIDRGLEGAMFCCSPPPRDEAAQQACWTGLKDGSLAVYSSDHAPYRYDASGKLPKGEKTTFKEMANGVPGLELRLPLLFTFGVGEGRLSLGEFVQLTATRHADIYGLPQKGRIAIGADADIAVWDPQREMTIDASLLHDNTGYTPYTGRKLRGWPVIVTSRGEVIIDQLAAPGQISAARGRGRFLARQRSDALQPAGHDITEMAQLKAWGTPLPR
jgi:dihydropyrimidinase